MFGTVARLRVKPGMEDALRADFERQKQNTIPGLIGECLYRLDRDPQEIVLVVLFASREAYVANAQAPHQHEDYLRLLTFLEAEPEWHDGDIIMARGLGLAG
ncbi:MAG: putative quinol monooxygenase [Thermomicrobiales bacterium]|jgi:heme-degrading monooxygenase HmoA|nr:antibiotic biosynthesis monooxygenase [Thermomicrobiales bacterium]